MVFIVQGRWYKPDGGGLVDTNSLIFGYYGIYFRVGSIKPDGGGLFDTNSLIFGYYGIYISG